MSKVLSLSECTERARVGELATLLCRASQNKIRTANGFVIPDRLELKNGASNEVLRNFDRLGCKAVILRTSLIRGSETEETIVKHITRDKLLEAILGVQETCRQRGQRAAILVQEMLEAETSGIVFSINPATHDSSELLIEASLWMGKTVLGGQSEPDMILVDKRSGALALETDSLDGICISAKQVEELYTLVHKIEKLIDSYFYIDWAFDNNQLYVLRVGRLSWDTIGV